MAAIEHSSTNSFVSTREIPASPVLYELPPELTGPIPFPDQAKPNDVLRLYRENWQRANADLVGMSLVPHYGAPIRNFFAAVPPDDFRSFELKNIGALVGIADNGEKLRDVRRDLDLGLRVRGEHQTFWSFTRLELAQYLTGLLAKKEVNTYGQIHQVEKKIAKLQQLF